MTTLDPNTDEALTAALDKEGLPYEIKKEGNFATIRINLPDGGYFETLRTPFPEETTPPDRYWLMWYYDKGTPDCGTQVIQDDDFDCLTIPEVVGSAKAVQ